MHSGEFADVAWLAGESVPSPIYDPFAQTSLWPRTPISWHTASPIFTFRVD